MYKHQASERHRFFILRSLVTDQVLAMLTAWGSVTKGLFILGDKMTIEQIPWCDYYDCMINDELVNIDCPECINKNNGCGNCQHQVTKKILKNDQEIDRL
jgi:hypothetical protein